MPDSRHQHAGEHLDATQFAAEFEASARVLWTIAASVLTCRNLVDDVLQEAAVIGLGKLDQFAPGTHFTAWMGRIVRLVALNHARKRERHGARAQDAALLESAEAPRTRHALDTNTSVEVLIDSEYFDDALTEALGELGITERACLLMKVVLELGYAEIAAILEIPQGTAMSHVHRARTRLRTKLAPALPNENRVERNGNRVENG
jgi:RNA polymerase sigma-70 factor (ECF subfamily)